MKNILITKINENYSDIYNYIRKNSRKKELPIEIEEEILPELILFLMEPFEGNSIEKTIKEKTLNKRKLEIENILKKENMDFLKYCYRWINNNMNWTYGNLFYRRSKIMADDSLEYSTDDETISVFETKLQEYYDYHNLDEYIDDLTEDNEEKLIKLRKVVEGLPQWEKNLYQLYFRDGNNLTQTAKIVGLSNTSIFNMVKKLKIKLNNLCNEKIYY